jgi:hypothetical protein
MKITGFIMLMCECCPSTCSFSSKISSFVDRDIFMRFRGGGVGHRSTWHLNDRLDCAKTNGEMPDKDEDEDMSGASSEDGVFEEESESEPDDGDKDDNDSGSISEGREEFGDL